MKSAEFIKQVKKLDLQPGQYVVIKANRVLSAQQHAAIRAGCDNIFRDKPGVKVIVLDGGMEMELLNVRELERTKTADPVPDTDQ